jgi:hypothetical protein
MRGKNRLDLLLSMMKVPGIFFTLTYWRDLSRELFTRFEAPLFSTGSLLRPYLL